MENLTYCSAGQLSPLMNDPLYETIGIGTSIWLAGARGLIYAEGTQHTGVAPRGENGVPTEGAGTLALTGDMKKMLPEYVRGVSLKGYGVSLAIGVGVPIPVLNRTVLLRTTVRDRDIKAPVIDYSSDYPNNTGKVLCHLSYEELKRGEVVINNKKVASASLSSYSKAREIAAILKDEITRGDFLLSEPSGRLSSDVSFNRMKMAGA